MLAKLRWCHLKFLTLHKYAHNFLGGSMRISSVNLHYGEEPPISAIEGSGTVFFSGCNLSCQFCQNYPISQLCNGSEYTIIQLAKAIVNLQKRGAHNINFVTPSHYTVHIIRTIQYAREIGLTIPIVYNTSGYDSLEQLRMLEDIVDIYLPDIRYQNGEMSKKYSGVTDYPEINKIALIEMFRQKGNLMTDDEGIGTKGMIIRHLVMPNNIANSPKALKFIAEELSTEMFISLMSQFFPAYNSRYIEEISRRLLEDEWLEATNALEKLGLENGWIQHYP